jgi:hypothetical protein
MRLGEVAQWASCLVGLTRASIGRGKKLLAKQMDRRVKPGDDAVDAEEAPA